MVADKYRIMRVGSSIGRNYGPMVVALAERVAQGGRPQKRGPV